MSFISGRQQSPTLIVEPPDAAPSREVEARRLISFRYRGNTHRVNEFTALISGAAGRILIPSEQES
jgi:hypothetical protein